MVNHNDPVKFCHIAPTKYLSHFAQYNGAHLILAHLVESDRDYRNFYANLDDGKYKIMDNSAFEMFKQGRDMYDSSKLIKMASECKADCIVLTDYPREASIKTIEAATRLIGDVKSAGSSGAFDTFFCPQSQLGDLEDLMFAFEWALSNPNIDLIGVSILACPIALGIDEKAARWNDAHKLQRFLSRLKIFSELECRGLLDERAIKRFHCLGMVDGPNEVELLRGYHPFIRSWDSSAAVWAGLHNVRFDNSPSGLINGKFEKEVDFGIQDPLDIMQLNDVLYNIQTIDRMCR